MKENEEHVAVCIATFRRPVLLGHCLASVGKMHIPQGVRVSVIVADNDVQKSAWEVFQQATAGLPFAAHYEAAPERGLSAVRNCLLEAALALQATHIAFIDDDELVSSMWLVRMIEGLHQYRADIVCGPVIATRENIPPEDFQQDTKRQSGSIARTVACGNVLFHVGLVSATGLRFDRRFNFTGSEDHDFFGRAKQQGAKAIWIADATVFETVTPQRDTRRYRIYRHFSGGVCSVLLYRKRRGYLSVWPHYLLKITGKCIDAVVHLLLAPFTSPAVHGNKFLYKLAYAAGCLCGLCGLAGIVAAPYRYE